MQKHPKSLRWLVSSLAAALAAPGLVLAQQQGQEGSDEPIEEIITTGTRRAQRSAADSAVPIDVVSGQEFVNMGTSDLDDMLRNTVPSYNVTRQAISDAATLVRPATLRGLPPDNSLILVNGKRRHRSGVIAELGGSLAAGSQGADISAIPALAIKQTEILRDGASAQYGSDAIAGVMNFVLKDAADGYTAELRTGEFFEGDGTMYQFAANGGFPLGSDGFANVTFQYMEQDETARSTQRTDAATLIAEGNTAIRQPFAQIWGGPEYRDNFNLFFNSGITLSPTQEVYAFGNYGGRETEGDFFFRNPNSRPGVFTNSVDGVNYRAVVDTNIGAIDPNTGLPIVPLGSTDPYISNCPALVAPPSGGSGNDIPDNVVQDDLAAIANLPANCWVLNQVLPGGYTPRFGGTLEDSSIVGGLRGEFENGLLYDFSASFGRNAVDFFLNNTWNPSRGPDGIGQDGLQRDFRIGEYIQTETNLNADFVLPIPVDAFASDLNFAFGAEWRDEIFTVRIGEENAWDAGRFAFQSGPANNRCYGNDPVNPTACATTPDGNPIPLPNLSIGAHGFAGFSPQQAGKFGRSNWAGYVEGEADITEAFTLAVAVRHEDFEDFGTTTNGKIAGRLEFTDTFALRGSASTGFRAPTPGQSNITKVSTVTVDGELQQRGQIPPTNPIAQFLGAEALEPEEAVNYTFGFVWDPTDRLSITADFFQIELDDRISQTGTIDIDGVPIPAEADCPTTKGLGGTLGQCLEELGVPGAGDLSSISFYTNDFETTTTGIDVVATYDLDWGNAGSGALTAAWNWTETEVDDAGEEVSRNRVVDLENFNPEHRGIFTYNHFLGDSWRFLVRASYYGEWVDADWSGDPTDRGPQGTGYTIDCDPSQFRDQCVDGQWLFDVEAAYTFADNWTAILGAQNVADEFGPIDQDNLDGTIGSGNTYLTGTPWGFDGGFWYFRVRADFE